MITSIYVNGFRSLTDFWMNINPGLNILIGPNGSGKTNIITFFEFLSHIVSYGPTEAVNLLGGAGAVFTKISEKKFQNLIRITLSGCTESVKKERFINYKYDFIIEASENFDSIGFKEQTLSIKYVNSFNESLVSTEDYFTIIQKMKNQKEYTFDILNYKKSLFNASVLSSKARDDFKDKNVLIEFLQKNLEKDVPLVSGFLPFFIESYRFIYSDLMGGKVFNIIPSRVKHPEESSSPIGIQKDGSGLAATLYAIQNKKIHARDMFLPAHFIRKFGRERIDLVETSITDILKYLRTANNAIKNIEVESDHFDNLLKIKFTIEKKDNSTVLPLSAMSDGTIKWLSLVTAILTSPSIFSLEEPENFLHPLMQSEVVKLMRNTATSKKKRICILMSTHSETILNNAKPSEIVIVSFKDGQTKASRCQNQDEIMEEIQNTGFGLGFYYISGSLTDD